VHLKYYLPGEAFGELALLYNAPRAASIVASEASELWALDRRTFNHIVKDSA
jgi:cAMP-dependent protein kinase regulator